MYLHLGESPPRLFSARFVLFSAKMRFLLGDLLYQFKPKIMVSTKVADSTAYGNGGAEHQTFQINQQQSLRVNLANTVVLKDLGQVKVKTFPAYRSFVPVQGGANNVDQVYLLGKGEDGQNHKFNFTGSAQSGSATGVMNEERLKGATREDGKPLWVELPVEQWPKEYVKVIEANGEKTADHVYAVRTAPLDPARFEFFLGKEAGEKGRQLNWKISLKGDSVIDEEIDAMFEMDFANLV